MDLLKIVLLFMTIVWFIASFVFADGNSEKGKVFFNDPLFAGATGGKTCNSCHPEGKGLDKTGSKKEFSIMGERQAGLDESVNFCIVHALKGNALSPQSEDMANIISYIRSLRDRN